jgi:transcription initiation factor IIE alpha subunit
MTKECAVYLEEEIALECPYCQEDIFQPLRWFKQTYFTCPACGGGLAAGQFETLITELEEAFEATVEQMVQGEPAGGCCGSSGPAGKGGGCGSGC